MKNEFSVDFLESHTRLSSLIKHNAYQLNKIVFNIKKKNLNPGFDLECSIVPGKESMDFDDRQKSIIVDYLYCKTIYTALKSEYPGISSIIADASINNSLRTGTYCVMIKSGVNEKVLSGIICDIASSNLCEMIAVIKGLEYLKDCRMIRIITDNYNFRKGISERIIHWKANNWKTCNNVSVKNVDCWKKIDELTRGKYIEIEWIKGHNGHFEHTKCHKIARELMKVGGKTKAGLTV